MKNLLVLVALIESASAASIDFDCCGGLRLEYDNRAANYDQTMYDSVDIPVFIEQAEQNIKAQKTQIQQDIVKNQKVEIQGYFQCKNAHLVADQFFDFSVADDFVLDKVIFEAPEITLKSNKFLMQTVCFKGARQIRLCNLIGTEILSIFPKNRTSVLLQTNAMDDAKDQILPLTFFEEDGRIYGKGTLSIIGDFLASHIAHSSQ